MSELYTIYNPASGLVEKNFRLRASQILTPLFNSGLQQLILSIRLYSQLFLKLKQYAIYTEKKPKPILVQVASHSE